MKVFSTIIGRFGFPEGTELSQAKLVRDMVLGQFLDPQPHLPKLKTESDCYQYVKNNASDVLANIPFKVVLT